MKSIADQWKDVVFMSSGLGALGGLLIFWMTGPYGLIVTSESVRHFQAARSFAMGEGLVHPYAALLSAGYFVGLGLSEWSRAVGVFLFGLNIALVSSFTFYVTGKVRGAALAGAAMLIFTPAVAVHAAALPGPFFLACGLAVLWALVHHLKLAPRMALMVGRACDHRGFKGAVIALFLLAGLMAIRTVGFALDVHQRGRGYAARAWTDTALVKTVKTLADKVPVYTNDPQAFYFYAGRTATGIASGHDDGPCPAALETLHRDFLKQGALAVIFDAKTFAPGACWSQFVHTAPLTELFRDGWGVILGFRKPAAR